MIARFILERRQALAGGWRWLATERFQRLAWLAGGRALAALIGFGSVVFLASILSPAAVGAWSIMLAIQGYALQVSDHGLRTVVMAESSKPGHGARGYLPAYLATRLTITACVYAVTCLFTWIVYPDWLGAIALLLVSLFAVALFLDWLALVEDRYQIASILLVVRPAIFLIALLVLQTGLTLDLLAGLFAGAWIIAAATSWLLLNVPTTLALRRWVQPHHQTRLRIGSTLDQAPPGPMSVNAMVRAGRPIMLAQLIGQAMVNLDLVVVGVVLGLAAAGQYFLAAAMATAGLVVANAAGQIANARLGRLIREPKLFDAELIEESTYLAWLATGFVVLLAHLANPLVAVFFGDAYAHAATLLIAMLPWFWLAHQSALLQAALAVRQMQQVLLLVALQAAMVLLVGLMISSIWQAALVFAGLRGVVEGARVWLLTRHLPGAVRQRLLINWLLPGVLAAIAVAGSLMLYSAF